MVYVALLRGINVGGNNKVDMKTLCAALDEAGLYHVRSYINSGNIIFSHPSKNREMLVARIEKVILETFGLKVPCLLRSRSDVATLIGKVPSTWTNDAISKTDVLLFWPSLSLTDVRAVITTRPDIDTLLELPDALVWSVDRSLVTRSGLLKLIGTPPYRQITIRNINTMRKLHELLGAQPDV